MKVNVGLYYYGPEGNNFSWHLKLLPNIESDFGLDYTDHYSLSIGLCWLFWALDLSFTSKKVYEKYERED